MYLAILGSKVLASKESKVLAPTETLKNKITELRKGAKRQQFNLEFMTIITEEDLILPSLKTLSINNIISL